jgi:DNA-binding response OmpR family regulator
VVEDEPSITNLLSNYLVKKGYNCVTTSMGEDGLTKLPITHADLVLLDLRLSGISGMDVLREAASMGTAPSVIALTALTERQTVIEAMKTGAVDYIVKPFKLEEVNDSIKRALGNLTNRENEKGPRTGSAEIRGDEPDWTVALGSIARAVEIRLQSKKRHAMIVLERTTAIVLEIDIPKDYIARWVEDRQRKIAEEMEYMSSLLGKLEDNPRAQILLGTSDLYGYEPREYNPN